MEKIGARHSAETQAHHEAIQKCMNNIADSCGEAQSHVNALLGKDDADSAARPGFTKREAERTGDSESTASEGSAAITKVAAIEESVDSLRSDVKELGQALANLAEAVAKLTGDDRARAARTAVPVFTVRKEDDGKPCESDVDEKSVHELVKQALQKPQRASSYLR